MYLRRRGFTLIELLVVISIIALLLSILMPGLSKVKEQARALICKTNLRSLQTGLNLYGADHNERLFGHNVTDVYINPISPYIENVDDARYCPSAPEKRYDPAAINGRGTADRPWGWNAGTGETEIGSYAFNGFFYNPNEHDWAAYLPSSWLPDGYWPYSYFNSLADVRHTNKSACFVDSMWVDTWPLHTDSPPTTEDELYYGTTNWGNFMGRVCLDRHDMSVNCSFVDGHVEKVKLEDLWTLYWNKLFESQRDIRMPSS